MLFLIMPFGLLCGFLLFLFTFTASKRSGKYYMAPLVTFFAAGAITMFGLIFVGGFEGMSYGMLGFGFLVAAIIGTILLPIKLRKDGGKRAFSNKDKWSLFLIPLILIVLVGSLVYFNEEHWIIEEGTRASNGQVSEGYATSTIAEGRKMVSLSLGEKYVGKTIRVEKVKQRGATTIVIEIKDDGKPGEVPYIKIGVDEIVNPLTIETTDGVVIGPGR